MFWNIEWTVCHPVTRVPSHLVLAIDDATFAIQEILNDAAVNRVTIPRASPCVPDHVIDDLLGGKRSQAFRPDWLAVEQIDSARGHVDRCPARI